METNSKYKYHLSKIFTLIFLAACIVVLTILVIKSTKTNKVSAATGDLVVNFNNLDQHIDGFGASDAIHGSFDNTAADLLFSQTNGIGLSILRVGINPDGTDMAPISDAQEAVARGAIVWATPWTPPANFKDNNSTTNGGHLLPADYDAWANILAGYVTMMKNNGVQLYGVSAQNEPDFSASYVSALYTNQEMVNFVQVLGPKLHALNPPVKLIAPESSNWGSLWGYGDAILGDSGASAATDIIATHDYTYSVATHAAISKPIWETEVSTFDGPTTDIGNGLMVATWIHNNLTIGNVDAWHYWWADYSGDNQGLLLGTTTPKRFWATGNFSKFIRPGFYRVDTTGGPSGVLLSAYKDPNTGNFVIVAVNPNGSTPLTVDLSGLTASSVTPWETSASLNLATESNIAVSNNSFNTTLDAQSVTSFVGQGSTSSDTIPPTISISAPANGATVSGSTSIAANASDNVAVAGVQFKLDGNNLGGEDTASPYSISWDTTTASNGSHTLTAVARDTSNNTTTSSSVSVTVNNTVTPPPPPPGPPPPPPPPGTIAFVQKAHSNFYTNNCSISTGATGTGDLLVVLVAETQKNVSVASVSDNAGTQNNYTHWTGADISDNFALKSEVWYKANSNSGGTTVTVTFSGGPAGTCFFYEFSGAATSNPTGVMGTLLNQTSANPEHGGTVTPANSADVLISLINEPQGSGEPTGASGSWTGFMNDSSAGAPGSTAYLLPGNTNAQTPSFTGDTVGKEYNSLSVSFLAGSITSNQLPVGNFDGLKSDGVTLQGWSYDPDSTSTSNNVQIFVNGPVGTGTLIFSGPTSILRTDVNTTFSITGNHGFEFAIPSQYQDGVSHSYYVYGIDVNDGTKSTLLTGSPLSFTVGGSSTYQRTISIASLDGRSTKVISGSLDVLNSSKGLIKTYAFTTNSSGTATITFDIPTQTVFLKVRALPFLTRLLSNVNLANNTTYAFPILLTGDINQDDIVNSIDFSSLNSKWFTSDVTSDLNQDGIVNSLDFSLLNKNWFVVGEQ